MLNPFKPVRSPTAQAVTFSAGIFTMIVVLAVAWEFLLEDSVMAASLPGWQPESFDIHMEYVLTIGIFTVLALVMPTVVLRKYIVRRNEAELKALHLATHDPLTNLPNRCLFNDRLEHALAQYGRHGGQFAVMYMDLDNFKGINDLLGHDAGDTVLRSVADRLRQGLRKTDTAARMGGDEFVLIVTDLKIPDQLYVFIDKLQSLIRAPIAVEGKQVTTDASLGFAVFPDDGQTVRELMHVADQDMYLNKAGNALSRAITPPAHMQKSLA